ncbi:MAG TPA: 1-(5-phosphoribosyl)-5-[(5-phosphoribosylamino)methylideneamino]imidazole-4-carboxamide isomerase [Cyclobacteriaceae bacterium]
MHIIPAIDLIDGKCVRLTQGDYAQEKVYRDNPLDVAREFQDAGFTRLHVVDLDGAKSGRVVNWNVIETICSGTSLKVDVGGGIKKEEDLRRLFDSGANQVNLGSIAVRDPGMVRKWIQTYGARIILSADVRDGYVAISGWQEASRVTVDDLIKSYLPAGLSFVTCTDISADGTLAGPAVDLYEHLVSAFPTVRIIASGGVGSINDIEQLAATNVYGVIVGKALYEGKITAAELTARTER